MAIDTGQHHAGVAVADPAHIDAIDSTRPHSARRYNYWLGGKDNFAVDRESGDMIAAAFPTVRVAAQENRRFLQRAVRFLAGEVGIRQFLDIGTGLPTADNTHEVAQRIAPESRIVYVDNDPMVLVHARALLTSTPEGRTAYLEGDLREPEKILAQATLRDTLDMNQPVALMLVAVLHFIPNTAEAMKAVRTLLDALAPGSYLAMTHATMDFSPPEHKAAYEQFLAAGKIDAYPRTKAEIEEIFAGLEIVEPGIVAGSDWRAEGEPQPRPRPAEVANYGVVARL